MVFVGNWGAWLPPTGTVGAVTAVVGTTATVGGDVTYTLMPPASGLVTGACWSAATSTYNAASTYTMTYATSALDTAAWLGPPVATVATAWPAPIGPTRAEGRDDRAAPREEGREWNWALREWDRPPPPRPPRPQDRALDLFRSLLTAREQGRLARRGTVVVRGSAGGLYRLHPGRGEVARVAWRRGGWGVRIAYCIHSVGHELPPADESVAHPLLLRADEPAFLRTANVLHEWR